jgi:hypothetical protein
VLHFTAVCFNGKVLRQNGNFNTRNQAFMAIESDKIFSIKHQCHFGAIEISVVNTDDWFPMRLVLWLILILLGNSAGLRGNDNETLDSKARSFLN